MKSTKRFAAMLLCFLTLALPIRQAACAERGIPIPADLPLAQSRVLRLRLPSAIMGFDVPFLIYLPKGYGGGISYPVWYALHSYSASETMWIDGERINTTADEMIAAGEISPLIMVFPFVRYDPAKVIAADMEDGRRDESQSARFVCHELVPHIDAAFQTDARAESRFIGGFSMGGLFALEIGLRHTGLFGRIGAYSPALAKKDYMGNAISEWLFPYEAPGAAADGRFNDMKIYLDSGGESDPFMEGVRSLARELPRFGASVTYAPHGGGHDLEKSPLTEYLAFYVGR